MIGILMLRHSFTNSKYKNPIKRNKDIGVYSRNNLSNKKYGTYIRSFDCYKWKGAVWIAAFV